MICNELYTGEVSASQRKPPIVERDDPFSVQPSVLIKNQKEKNKLAYTFLDKIKIIDLK